MTVKMTRTVMVVVVKVAVGVLRMKKYRGLMGIVMANSVGGVTMNEPTVTITQAEYEKLLGKQRKLSALEQLGVDNWEGYSLAMAEYDDENI
jgi:hypothetical protein